MLLMDALAKAYSGLFKINGETIPVPEFKFFKDERFKRAITWKQDQLNLALANTPAVLSLTNTGLTVRSNAPRIAGSLALRAHTMVLADQMEKETFQQGEKDRKNMMGAETTKDVTQSCRV